MTEQIALCTWCKTTWPVANAAEADLWLRTHPCPANPKEKGCG